MFLFTDKKEAYALQEGDEMYLQFVAGRWQISFCSPAHGRLRYGNGDDKIEFLEGDESSVVKLVCELLGFAYDYSGERGSYGRYKFIRMTVRA